MSKTTTPCCSKDVGIKKGPWTPEEDEILADFVRREGEGRWRTLPKRAGLHRCGKSCRLRWMNYLRPSVKRGHIALDEEDLILRLHRLLGNRWALIAGRIPGRTDNEIKNYWNTRISKKLIKQGIDPRTHKPLINTTTTNGFNISDSQNYVEHHVHESSNVTSPNPIPTPQPNVMGLSNHYHHHHHHPALEFGSSSSSTQTNNLEVPIITTPTSTDDGKLEYQNNEKGGIIRHGNEHGTINGNNSNTEDNEDTFLLFLNSLVNDDDEAVMSNTTQQQQPLQLQLQVDNAMFGSSSQLSTSFAEPAFNTLADWEAEFSNALNGGQYYGSPSSSPSM